MSIPSTENYFMGYEKGRADERAKIIEILVSADDSKNAMYLLSKYLIEEQLKEKKK